MRFEVLLGPEDGEQKGREGDRVTLGRGVENDIPFSYAGKVSGRHAEIGMEGGKYYIIDMGNRGEGSTNGTIILNKGIEIWREVNTPPLPGEKELIEPGDIIILGRSIWLEFL